MQHSLFSSRWRVLCLALLIVIMGTLLTVGTASASNNTGNAVANTFDNNNDNNDCPPGTEQVGKFFRVGPLYIALDSNDGGISFSNVNILDGSANWEADVPISHILLEGTGKNATVEHNPAVTSGYIDNDVMPQIFLPFPPFWFHAPIEKATFCSPIETEPVTGSVTVIKYREDDEQGYQGTEELLDGWLITVYDEQWGYVTEGTTDGNGEVTFELEVGTYNICEEDRDGWDNENPGSLCQEVEVAAGGGNVTPGPEEVYLEFNDNKDTEIKIQFISVVGNTWTYRVREKDGRDLSHWDLGIETCLPYLVGYSPSSGFESGQDGNTGFYGIKWNVSDSFSSGYFSFTLSESFPAGTVVVKAKAGNPHVSGEIRGPVCTEPEDQTIYFGNVELPTTGDLTIIKQINWGNFQANNAVTFEICVTGLNPECKEANFGNNYTVVWEDVEADDYSFSETVPGASWFVSYPGGQTATVVAGQNNTYYVQNTYTPPGSITVYKVVAGQYAPQGGSFEICVAGDCRTVPAGGSATWDGLQPGEYAVTETPPGGYWNVSGETTIDLAQGQDTSTTITNTYEPPLGSISVTKQVVGDDAPNQTFNICVDGDCKTFNAGQTQTWTDLPEGSYAITETDPGANWSKSGETTVQLAWGGVEYVTITNTYTAPTTTVTVYKVVDGDEGAPQGPFHICLRGVDAGASYPGGSCVDLNAGGSWQWTVKANHSYAISEDDPGADWSVSGETTIQVAPNQPASVTITNTYTAPEPECTSDPSVLSGYINIGPAQAGGYITNNASVPFCGQVGMASYYKYDEIINNQDIFQWVNPIVEIQPGQTIQLTVGVPGCQAQVDLFWGPVILDMGTGERYGVRLLAAVHSTWLPYCTPPEAPV